MAGLLDGVVVLDLGRVLACPYAAAMLGDLGATVIKIENPKGGDDTRSKIPGNYSGHHITIDKETPCCF